MADNSGRGYLPPTVPNPSAPHRRQWSVGPPSAPPATFYAPSQPWQVGHGQIHGAKPYLAMPPGHGSSSPQSESMDLSSSRPGQAEPTHNGDPINGQVKTAAAGVSVIAPNPLVAAEEVKLGEASEVGSKLFDRPLMDFVVPDDKMPSFPPASTPVSTSPDLKGLPVHPLTTKPLDQAGIPTPFEAKGPPAESEGNPSHPVESKVTLRPMEAKPMEFPFAPGVPPAVRPSGHRFPNPALPQDEPGLPPASGSPPLVEPLAAPPAPAPSLPPPPPIASQAPSSMPPIATAQASESAPSPRHAPEPDHVESLLENMFQVGDESPVKQSVIVSNTAKPQALTEDKVVAILEDKSPVESMEVKTEVKTEPEGNKFMEVESELEKMFAGIVEPVEDTKPTVGDSLPPESENPSGATPEQPKRRKRTPGKPRPRKSVDSDAPTEPRKRGRKPADKSGKSVKKPRHDKFKDASNDSSNMSGTTSKRGPYLYVEGPKETPTNVIIVNSGSRDEEERDRGMVKGLSRRKHHRVEGRLKGAGLYSSTLSAKYNAQNADLTWVCTFCKLRSNCEKGLAGEPAGDLFGPYILTIPKEPELDPREPKDSDVVAEQKRRGGGKQASLRAVGGAEQFIKDVVKKNKKTAVAGEDLSGEQEIWVHEKCAVWAPGVFLVGHHLVGLAEAVAAASVTKCSYCSQFGASLGCVVRNCPVRCHYGCAVATRWDLNYDTFIAKCPSHTRLQKT